MCRDLRPTFLNQKEKISLLIDGNTWKTEVPEGLEK